MKNLVLVLGLAIAGGIGLPQACSPAAALPAVASGDLLRSAAAGSPIPVHGRRYGRWIRGPHCRTAWHPRRGWHRHWRWCRGHWRRSPRWYPRRGCYYRRGDLWCRF